MKTRRGALSALCIAGVLVVAACGSDGNSSSGDTAAPGTAAPGGTAAAGTTPAAGTSATGGTAAAGTGDSILNGTIKCEQQYAGKEVHIFSPVRDSETDKGATRLRDGYKGLEDCTGVKVVYDGTDQF